MQLAQLGIVTFISEYHDSLSVLVAAIAVCVTAIFGFVQLRNSGKTHDEETKFRKAEASYALVAKILASEDYRTVARILDVDGLEYEHDGKRIPILHKDIPEHFRLTDLKMEPYQFALRECLDRFAQLLALAELGVRDGYLSFDMLAHSLRYEVKNITKFPAILKYLEHYELQEAVLFVQRFTPKNT